MRLKADLTLLLAALVWGLGFIAQRNAAIEVGALLFNAARWTLGGLVMLPFIRFNLHLDRKTMPWMAAGGLILFAASGLQQTGLKFTTAGNAGFITGTYVVIIPILLSIFWKERSSWSIWLAAFMTTIGIYMLGSGGVLHFNFGDGIVLIGAVMWALHVIITGKGVKHVPVLPFVTGQFLICGILNMVFGLTFQRDSLPALIPAWPSILYLALISTGVGFTLQAYGQRHAPPADAAIILSLEAVFAALFGWLILSEKLTAIQIVGCLLIMAAILISQLLSSRPINKEVLG
jgi:drug/metabolite transporter (DMT)-like permease